MTTEKEVIELAARYFMKELGEITIDDECVGCCKVVDVAAKLQKELDSTMCQLVDSRKRCDHLSIELESREAELFDLKNAIPDNFWAVVTEKDSMIRRQGKVIEDFKTIETRETDRLHKIIDDYKEAIQLERIDHMTTLKTVNQYSQTKIKELKDNNINDLKELYDLDKEDLDRLKNVISARDLTIKSLTGMCQSGGAERNGLVSIVRGLEAELSEKNEWLRRLASTIETLEAELSARKEDSEVLMKVVDTIRCWESTPIGGLAAVTEIKDIIDDYLDVPEGPEDTPIDEPQEITVTFAWLELP